MAGHSHWAGIKHKKGANDAKRGKLFSKLAKHIIAAARQGGEDPEANLHLKYAIDRAKAVSMPKDNIERAINRGAGVTNGEEDLFEIMYEGYGSGGIALLIEGLTDNRNRTSAEVRKIFERRGGNLGSPGSVAWQFEKKGLFVIQRNGLDGDTLMEIALEANADEFDESDESFEITCSPEDFMSVKSALDKNEIEVEVAELSYLPNNRIEASPDDSRKVLALMEELEDHDDVQEVHSNLEIPEQVLEELKAEG
jgi:YebC/PmpR family DNA-binding regulatory protein